MDLNNLEDSMTHTATAPSTVTIWTLTLDFEDNIVTTVHFDEVYGTLRDVFGEDREDELPEGDDDLVDYLAKPSWEGGIGAVFYIERHILDCRVGENAGREGER